MARDEARAAEITELAARVLCDHGARGLPVDPLAVARAKDLTVEALPLSERMLGFIMQCGGNRFAIGFNAHLESQGLRHFTLAHELGHYCLDGHALALLHSGNGFHACALEPGGGSVYEKEADQFATDLLMPEDWFRAAAAEYPIDRAGVQRMAELCRTSLTATATRYTRLSPAFCISIRSDAATIRYGFLSDTARDLFANPGDRYLKGRPVPANSLTHVLNTRAPVAIPLEGREAWLIDWLPKAPRMRVREEVQSLGRFGTLTVLTLPE